MSKKRTVDIVFILAHSVYKQVCILCNEIVARDVY